MKLQMNFFLHIKVHMKVQKKLHVRVHEGWGPSSSYYLATQGSSPVRR